MSIRMVTCILVSSLAAGCATVNTVGSSGTEKSINTLLMTANRPYPFEQDCGMSGAQRVINIDGTDVRVAGSADGRTVLVMDAHPIFNAFMQPPLMLNNPVHSEAVNDGCLAVQKVMDKNEIEVLLTRPVKSLGNIDGYVLELDGDGYSLLKSYSKEK